MHPNGRKHGACGTATPAKGSVGTDTCRKMTLVVEDNPIPALRRQSITTLITKDCSPLAARHRRARPTCDRQGSAVPQRHRRLRDQGRPARGRQGAGIVRRHPGLRETPHRGDHPSRRTRPAATRHRRLRLAHDARRVAVRLLAPPCAPPSSPRRNGSTSTSTSPKTAAGAKRATSSRTRCTSSCAMRRRSS